MHMYCQPTPSPIALPIPIPVPLLIPSTRVCEQRKVHSEAEQAQEKGEEERLNLGQGGMLALPAKRENSKSKRKSEITAASAVASPASSESRSRLSHCVAAPSSSIPPNPYLDPEVEILNSIGNESKARFGLGHKAWKLWADGALKPNKGQPSVFLSLPQSERASALYAFVSEAQRPNGQDYRPDCLYYLCLGLQRYLSEAGIEDDIFSDSIYGDFFGALSSKLAAWQAPESQRSCLSSQLLWLSGRLGARSPSSLQAALSYFLFWGFGIRNVDAHAQLTFSRIAAGPRKARRAGRMERRERRGGCKPLCLGLYPAVSPTCEQGNSGRKRRREDEPEKEIPEDAENPLHCPVRLFEFYISKCPAEVRARDGPLYLEPLVPCDPDSNLWFSDTALSPRSLLSLIAPLPHLQDLSLKKTSCRTVDEAANVACSAVSA
uniref:zinc finger MYM-type protein 3-like n=1 Tax=Myxine glutinosa TaxID=7769 RepID=UPI00358E6DF7